MDSMDKLRRLLVFVLLMEKGKGLLDKSPMYILGQFESVMTSSYPMDILDTPSIYLHQRYWDEWREQIIAYDVEHTPEAMT